jgi:hypothetical protein
MCPPEKTPDTAMPWKGFFPACRGMRIPDKEFYMTLIKNLFFVGLAVLAIILTGCKHDPSPWTPNLPLLDVSKSTGQTEIKLADVDLKDAADMTISSGTINGTDGFFSAAG